MFLSLRADNDSKQTKLSKPTTSSNSTQDTEDPPTPTLESQTVKRGKQIGDDEYVITYTLD